MPPTNQRVLSGMRPTGRLHLGHYHGVLKNWLELQHRYDCYFCIVDWHALTTHYEDPSQVRQWVHDVAVDWLAVGIDPTISRMFIQSHVRQHAELHLLLSMGTPLPWLERVPSFKDQQEKLKDRDLATYGFLGYPLLQSADILLYRADFVPVGEDQVPHVELTREIARRFNNLYGREPDFQEKADAAVRKMGKKNARRYQELRQRFQQDGDVDALENARSMLANQANLTIAESERLLGYLEGMSRTILPEPEVLLTPAAKVPGLDGQKMSKSYGNTIGLREDADSVAHKIRTMPTDPARVRRTDPGDPDKCPVWDFHRIYSDKKRQNWVMKGCTTAGIGCLDCKAPIVESIEAELAPIRERAEHYDENPALVRTILSEGAEEAREVAEETMEEVRHVMGLPET